MASSSLLLFLATILGLAVNVAFQMLLFRAAKRSFNLSVLGGTLAGLAVTCGTTLPALADVPSMDGLSLFLMNTVTSLALSFCYWNFLNMNMTSLRIRMVKELARAGGTMSHAEILAMYHPREMLDRRIKRLAAKQQIRLENGRYYAQGTWAAALVRIIALLRRIILPSTKG